MLHRIAIVLFLSLELTGVAALCQKKISILGSSTAAGGGASVFDSSWAGRLQAGFRKNKSDGIDTIVDDRAVAGYVTYQGLPTTYLVPDSRPSPDPYHNVTFVLNDVPRPDIVIINYPTNDIVNGYDPKEMMDNLRLMYQQLTSRGITCFVATSQPRNGSMNDSTRTILRHLVDSVNNNFGYYAINFWEDLVAGDGTNRLRADLTPDGVHPNDAGHRFLFERVQAKGLFVLLAPLPVVLSAFDASYLNHSVKISWSVAQQDPDTFFEVQRSADGISFHSISKNATGNLQKASYSWTDYAPLPQKNFYRLKINEQGRTIYSKIVAVNAIQGFSISQLYQNGSVLYILVNSNKQQKAEMTILNASGGTVKKQTVYLTCSNNSVRVAVFDLAAGNYFLTLNSDDGTTVARRFLKLK